MDIVSPWHAAIASAIAFLTGAVLPMLAILLPPENVRVPMTFAAVLVALAATGAIGAWIGGGSKLKAAIRVVIGGAAALVATFLIGSWIGASGIAS
jgi:VIT1/CCC1 family predicted Fe2+/Mn2+ transporter